MVGLLPFALTSSSGSHSVLPYLVMTSTPACLASFLTSSSRARAYASVSFSKTRCVTLQDLNSLGSRVCGASRSTWSLELELSFVMLSETSFWQSSLRLHELWEVEVQEAEQILEAVGTDTCTVHVVRIPAPNGPEAFRLQLEGCSQRGRIMQS